MSCNHIDPKAYAYLLKASLSKELNPLLANDPSFNWWDGSTWQHMENSPEGLCQVARIIERANLESLSSVYPREPKTVPQIRASDMLAVWDSFDPVQVLKTCDYIEYQCNDAHTWPRSEAENIIQTIRAQATRALSGYADAVWGMPDDTF